MVRKFASLLQGLFGARAAAKTAEPAPSVEYNGFAITPQSFRDGDHWVSACRIAKAFPDGAREHFFVRSDLRPTREAADAFVVTKAKRAIDELGDRVLDG